MDEYHKKIRSIFFIFYSLDQIPNPKTTITDFFYSILFDRFNWDFCLNIKIENADRTVYSYQLTKLIFVKIRNFQF